MQRELSLLKIAAIALAAAVTGSGADHRSVPRIVDFSLEERESDIARKLGPSEHLSTGTSYRTLDYVLGPEERGDEDFDWTFYFERPSGALISVTRNFATPANVEDLLKGDGVRSHVYRGNSSGPVRAVSRVLPGNRILVAIGLSKLSDPCSQIILMRRTALGRFFPWIEADLTAQK